MTVSQTLPKVPEGKQLIRTGIVGMAIGGLAILVCELPMILAVLGLGGFAGAMALRWPIIEIVAIIIAIVGAGLLLFVLVRRIITLQKRSWP